MPDTLPGLVVHDPWLEPYADHIQQRMDRCERRLAEIRKAAGSIREFAGWHHEMGIHLDTASNKWSVREWAPAAKSVSLIGEFNDWNTESHPLLKDEQGCWATTLPGDTLKHGQLVKLHIVGADDSVRDRIPACILRTRQDETTHDFSGQIWHPETPYQWQHEFKGTGLGAPLIYEAHVGMSGEEPRVHTYREFADEVLPRIKKAGYNVIQLMAIAEHPYYGSFGYHVSNFFAPASRFGTPEDLKYLVDTAHGLGVAVLMDLVHSHSVKNYGEGLNNFDGSGGQYFHADDRGDHPGWDSKCFDYGRPEVQRFLLSNLRYWLEEFRFDGFRFDGVTSLLYWHRGTASFDHYDKYFVENVDEDAVLYLQLANTLIKELTPHALVIAEDMSGMPGLCRPLEEGGLGFTHRLAMGIPDYWIKLLKHSRDEEWNLEQLWSTLCNRRHGEANIAYAESHDQALVGDKTLAFWLMDQEMYWHMNRDDGHPVIDRGIALHKMIRLITLVGGGEGWLNFMGNEFGHPEWLDFPREGNNWSYHHCRRQWSLMDNPDLRYTDLSEFDAAMIALARRHDLLDSPPAQLLHVHNDNMVLIAERKNLIFAFNFSPQDSFADYRFTAPDRHSYRLALDSDAAQFGGHDRLDPSITYASIGDQHQLSLYLPTRTALVLERI
jgi:1,4-alpha-glucan branching enzyme